MSEFRCDFFDARGGISFHAHIRSAGLEDAKKHAWTIFHANEHGRLIDLRAFEIWEGEIRVWPDGSVVQL